MPSDLLTRVVSEAASQMGLIPLVWLGWLHLTGKRLDVAWWWLGAAFFVSWLADMGALWMNPWILSKVYPLSQAAIIGLVFLSRREALLLIVALTVVGLLDVAVVGIGDFDILLRTVAWLSVVGIIFPLKQLGRLRASLLVTFALGWLAWVGYIIWPGWNSYLWYQSTRLLGVATFCWAALRPMPHFKVIRASLT